MDYTQFRKPDRWWSPKLTPWFVRCCKPIHTRFRIKNQKLDEVEIRGLEHLQKAVSENAGVLITPNHSAHADAVVMYHTAHALGTPYFFMTAWQVLGLCPKLRSWFLRSHGCFSVDREGTDLRAFKQAVEILQNSKHPLAIFPEGEVYHLNERVTPFREGASAIVLAAARRAERPIYAIPCGLRYFYTEDPTVELLELMSQLETSMHWRPRPDVPLHERIYRLAEGILCLKELEYLGEARKGLIPERVQTLSDEILKPHEQKYGVESQPATIPERVKAVRQKAIEILEAVTNLKPVEFMTRLEKRRGHKFGSGRPEDIEILAAFGKSDVVDPVSRKIGPSEYKKLLNETYNDLDDVYLVTQMFSYPGDYVAEKPSIERMAETLDKFEEDILTKKTATIRGRRRAVVTFGEPIDVGSFGKGKSAATELTQQLEQNVQSLLDSVR